MVEPVGVNSFTSRLLETHSCLSKVFGITSSTGNDSNGPVRRNPARDKHQAARQELLRQCEEANRNAEAATAATVGEPAPTA